MKKIQIAALVCLSGISWHASAQVNAPSNNLPPASGQYTAAGPVNYPTVFGLFTLSDLNLLSFSANFAPPTALGTPTPTSFTAFTELNVAINGVPTASNVLVPAPVVAQTTLTGQVGGVSSYDTEMLQLNLAGLPGGIMLRESPTLASTGSTTITDIGGGNFKIDSFFDIFTELSLDGGATWTPNAGPATRLDLVPTPEPSVIAMLSLGCGGLLLKLRRKH